MSARIYGLHAARAAIEHAPERIRSAWLDAGRRDRRLEELRQRLRELGIPVADTERKRLDRLAGSSQHQGIVLEVTLPRALDDDALAERLARGGSPLFLVLDQVQDPHNLGACLRTCDAVGAAGVIVPKDRSVGLTPTVCKVASGAAETVPLFRVTNLARTLEQMKAAGLWLYGADGNAEQLAFEADLSGPLALVMGAEGRGLRRLTREACDLLIKLPMRGRVESLNLSVAAGVLLYESLRQRLAKTSTREV
ncbi:23S rRNA (guanosine2251-2'-O)-methyltransferase [Methylomarinovum caldicuralii]|uniref:23S rRNA (guanosine-2'-O-)-methyltransferase RlmB n=1 Tax=Methylomarinovum caldicuralii TaxID=438856 RepID=A0AAU9C6X0_9GAMM|nr:23S rRNA (guanosine(2251)-2'-O)-methyltransferase RlmB [Methylomarinovum caldicuralii]BCX82935.1 23S rRNA (guanosine2251-2'-O)-methyltransferase [Methylomarinovum caldicuralii]